MKAGWFKLLDPSVRPSRIPPRAVKPAPLLRLNLQSTARGRVRLGTLNNLRWMAIVGQAVALLGVRIGFDFDFPLLLAASPIIASGLLNVMLAIAYPSSKRLSAGEATAFLAYDIVQLATLLFFTGGTENPFALMFLAPVVISAATLDLLNTVFLCGLAFAAITLLWQAHLPLPWAPVNGFRLPALYQTGIWVSLLLGIGFTSIYAWRIAHEAARMSAALSATQLALARERQQVLHYPVRALGLLEELGDVILRPRIHAAVPRVAFQRGPISRINT